MIGRSHTHQTGTGFLSPATRASRHFSPCTEYEKIGRFCKQPSIYQLILGKRLLLPLTPSLIAELYEEYPTAVVTVARTHWYNEVSIANTVILKPQLAQSVWNPYPCT